MLLEFGVGTDNCSVKVWMQFKWAKIVSYTKFEWMVLKYVCFCQLYTFLGGCVLSFTLVTKFSLNILKENYEIVGIFVQQYILSLECKGALCIIT